MVRKRLVRSCVVRRGIRTFIGMGSEFDPLTDGGWNIPAEIIRLRRIPSECRLFSCTTARAEKEFGLSAAVLQALLATGLPYRGRGDTRRFDASDLHYVGLRLRTARTHCTGFAFVAKSLERFAANDCTELNVRYIPYLPDESQPVPGIVGLPDGQRRGAELQHNVVAAEATITLRSRQQSTPPSLVNAIAEASALDFYSFHPPLEGDTVFARETGLSDCLAGARIVAEGCRSVGYEARVVYGLQAAVPWSSAHYWCEVCVDGSWLPLDPLLIRTLTSFGSLDDSAWPVDRFCTPILVRFPPETPLVARADGSYVLANFPTSVRRAFVGNAQELAPVQAGTGQSRSA